MSEGRDMSLWRHRFFMALLRRPLRWVISDRTYYWLLDRANHVPLGQTGWRPLGYPEGRR